MTAAGAAADMRKLAVFIALSLGVHLLFVLGGALRLPNFDLSSASPPLSARLVPLKPTRPQPPPARPASSPPVDLPPVLSAEGSTPDSVANNTSINQPAAAVPVTTGSTLPAVTRTLPRAGELRYTLFLGADEFGKQAPNGRDTGRRDGLFTVGRTQQQWQIDGAGHYTLRSLSETTGLAALFASRRYAYESHGTVTAKGGLRPESFNAERERRGKTEQANARFDWQAMRATFGAANEQSQETALHTDTQDLMSFMYQLGLMPLAPGRLTLPVSNGWKLETYDLDIGTEEIIDTPLGKLKALPVRQIRVPGKESIQLWLAVEYRMLPVRIRFFDRDGKAAGEQLINDIRVSPE